MSVLIQEVLSDPDLAHDDVFRRLLQAGLQDLTDAEATARSAQAPMSGPVSAPTGETASVPRNWPPLPGK
ncbi:hypothetical protein HMPREF1129_2066 [Actinomyces naeslundii str. Howell 279]|uniref:Uncharacterized protein n=1 Tax=Actinomyces naeslundii (strain ATCC 12104 / DSM 43013 / CCUG 2238 / JCM 8349 / NCTC 10301 / Howell 279) TaxID=1115803 RepID=J3AA78_ACTNH|nr:hypothetical protein HMPREF1129_2066 [Actinomyces naeslundii str. Howell 279]